MFPGADAVGGREGWKVPTDYGTLRVMVQKLHHVEPAAWGDTPPGLGASLIRVLEARVGQPTIVKMADGTELTVIDGSGWGRAYGHVWDHITAKLEPGLTPGWAWFMLSYVEALFDPDGRRELIRQVPDPGAE